VASAGQRVVFGSARAVRASAPSAPAASADSAYAEPAPARAQEAKARTARELYDQALSLYNAGDYAAASSALGQLTARADAASLRGDVDLLNARVLRRWRGCAAAIPAYRRLAEAASGPRGSALLELAECYEQGGQVALARTALEQAAGLKSSGPNAQRRLRALDSKGASTSNAAPTQAVESEPASKQ
jgi:hypothetical protein